MQIDWFGIARSGVAALALVGMLAGFSPDAVAYGAKGAIRLQLGGPNQWAYVDPSGIEQASEGISLASGRDALVKQCQYSTTGLSDLANLTAITSVLTGPFAADTFPIGLGPDSIGVYDNAKGVSCYRMTGSLVEGVKFAFGASVATLVGPGVIFDRLELDMEVKQDAEFQLKVIRDTVVTNYYLRSGGSIVAGQGTAGESNPLNRIFNCSAASDSGADAGPADNCRWIINDIGTRFELRAKGVTLGVGGAETERTGNGEGSLEGGGDFADSYANNTIIYLTSLSETGDLTCDKAGTVPPSADNLTGFVGGGPTALCRVTRIDPTNLGHPLYCDKPFPYLLSTELTASACNLVQNLASPDFTRPLAASVEVKFPFEPRTELQASGGIGLYPTPSPAAERTTVQFSVPVGSADDIRSGSPADGLTPRFAPERCEGRVVNDDNGNPTIEEVFRYPTFTGSGIWDNPIVDQAASSTPGILDWACILKSTIDYVGIDQQQRTDIVLFWGDARFESQ
jgi:hypothetical protein